jgi:hypothetical protein
MHAQTNKHTKREKKRGGKRAGLLQIGMLHTCKVILKDILILTKAGTLLFTKYPDPFGWTPCLLTNQ